MEEHGGPALAFALALGVGVLCQIGARHLRLPSIVLLLFAGVALGPDGLGWVRPDSLGRGLFHIVQLAVAIILFEGGLNLEMRRLRRENLPIRMLVTTGAAITAVGGAIAAHALMGWSWSIAALFGALVTVTGPTVVKPLLRLAPLRTRLATVLEAEGVLIDPIGAILAAVILEIVLEASIDSFALGLTNLVLRLGVGVGVGLASGWLLARALRHPRLVPEGFENLLTIGSALLIFETCDLLVGESGILAVTLAGVVVGNLRTRVGAELGEFEEQVTIGMIGVLFVLLAADVRVAEVVDLGAPGLWCVAALIFVVRPINVLASTAGSELGWREKAFLSWVAPRGVVAAAVASLFAAVLEARGVEGAREMRALVFLTIGVTVVLQGGTAPLVARLLDVRAPARDSYIILGAEGVGFAVADLLRGGGTPVVFIDSNPVHCRAAEEREFTVVYGNALARTTLARARPERARAALALTANESVNLLFAREARDDFGVRECYVALDRTKDTASETLARKHEGRVLFDRPKDVERWNVRFRHEAARVVALRFTGTEPEGPGEERTARRPAADAHLLLAVERGGVRQPAYAQWEPREGDLGWGAVWEQEEASGLEALRSMGWEVAEDAAPEAQETTG